MRKEKELRGLPQAWPGSMSLNMLRKGKRREKAGGQQGKLQMFRTPEDSSEWGKLSPEEAFNQE